MASTRSPMFVPATCSVDHRPARAGDPQFLV